MIVNLISLLPEKFVWKLSKKYIAGNKAEDVIKVAKEFNSNGFMVTINILGEFVKSMDEAQANRNDYFELIRLVSKEKIDGNYSLKPSMFGIHLDIEICYRYISEIVAKAAGFGNFIRVDMENSPYTQLELDLFRRLNAEFPTNCGLVLQAYMKRTLCDLESLMNIHSGESPLNLRLCKGIYAEPPELAYKNYEEINRHFLEDIELCFKNKVYTAIATHDKPIIKGTLELVEKHAVSAEKYEFQMLYGVTPLLRQSLLNTGHRVRVYIPYGENWFDYSTRRLKENPSIASHLMKAKFSSG